MELVLWRHCDAEDGVPDGARRLTPRGRAQARRIAAWLAPRLPAHARLVVSPAVRARETADALGRGASVDAALGAAGWPDAEEPALVVAHEPTLGRVVGALLGEGRERP